MRWVIRRNGRIVTSPLRCRVIFTFGTNDSPPSLAINFWDDLPLILEPVHGQSVINVFLRTFLRSWLAPVTFRSRGFVYVATDGQRACQEDSNPCSHAVGGIAMLGTRRVPDRRRHQGTTVIRHGVVGSGSASSNIRGVCNTPIGLSGATRMISAFDRNLFPVETHFKIRI